MNGTISQHLLNIQEPIVRRAVQFILEALADRFASCMLGSAAIVISGASGTTAKTGAVAVNAIASNSLVNIPAGTVLPALVGTVAQNFFNVYVFYIDNAGVITVAMGTPAATLASVIWPNTPQGKAIVGALTANPTTAPFIGGTTALDAANTNVVYISPVGAFDPSIFVGNF